MSRPSVTKTDSLPFPLRSEDHVPRDAFGERPIADEMAGIVAANAGDHALIHRLLLEACQGPSREEFHASQDDPFYEPSDRLLLKRKDGKIISHVHLTKRVMNFGAVQLPIAEATWLATLPEYESADYSRRLLRAAERQMRVDGAVAALAQTATPRIFESQGWTACGMVGSRRAPARRILAMLSERNELSPLAQPPLSTRMWRHVELRPLMELYRRNTQGTFGPLYRSEIYWQWLISRRAYDHILVAIEGDDTLDFGALGPKIVGYAVAREDRIVELMTEPGHPTAAQELLARACREAIERDYGSLNLDAQPRRRLEQLFSSSDLFDTSAQPDEVLMIKVVDAGQFVSRLYTELHARAKTASLARPCTLTFETQDAAHLQLTLTRRSARLTPAESLRKPDAAMTTRTFFKLLTGQFDPESPLDVRELRPKTKKAGKMITELFPHRPLMRPAFDNLPA